MTTTCPTLFVFHNAETAALWRSVNDGVMGGLSSGEPTYEGDHLLFKGVINTNGGGFSSIRAGVEPAVLADQSGLKLTVKSDGRDYRVSLRTSQNWRGRNIAWQAPIEITTPGEWESVTIAFSDLRPSVFGRSIKTDPFDKSGIRELGVIIADGQDGAFALGMKQIGCF